jgi:hypothetical protein
MRRSIVLSLPLQLVFPTILDMSPKVAKADRFSQESLTERERLGTVDLLLCKHFFLF